MKMFHMQDTDTCMTLQSIRENLEESYNDATVTRIIAILDLLDMYEAFEFQDVSCDVTYMRVPNDSIS